MGVNQPFDIFRFEGAGALNGTIANTAFSDQSAPDLGPRARVTSTSHGLTIIGSPAIFLQNLDNPIYNGIHRVQGVTTHTFDIQLSTKFEALTPAGTELWFVGCKYNCHWKFLGFDLHMSAAGGAAENLTVRVDAYSGSIYDTLLYTQDMNLIQEISLKIDPITELEPGDIIKFAYANSNSRTWGLKIFAQYAE